MTTTLQDPQLPKPGAVMVDQVSKSVPRAALRSQKFGDRLLHLEEDVNLSCIGQEVVAVRVNAGSRTALALTLSTAMVFALGCQEPYDTVEYGVTYGPVNELVFVNTTYGSTNATHEVFSTPVRVEEQLAFSGHVDAPMPERKRGYLKIRKRRGTEWTTFRTGSVKLEAADGDDGFQFRGEVKAPKRPGKYSVEITAGDALLAMGEIVVKEETSL
ncbi:MAG: hypothetical protein H8E66_24715 [Planctomycetes bacterium]|nr:hypothetical protein [Planctomycetota bacterium]